MLTHLIQATGEIPGGIILAAADPGGTTLNTDGIVGFIVAKIVPILLAVVGVIILSRSGKGQWSAALTTGGIAVLGIVFIAGAGLLFAFGESIAKLALGG
jgi:hypothetical protein